MRVQGTGISFLDRRNLQQAIDRAQNLGGSALLIGHFNLGICFQCVKITAPVTVSGQSDPTQNTNRRDVTIVSTLGGRGSIVVDEPPTAPSGTVEIHDIWLRGSTLSGFSMVNFYRGTLEYYENRVTNIRAAVVLGIGLRFAIEGVSLLHPIATKELTGSLIVANNYIDTTTLPFTPQGNDQAIALGNARFDTVDFSNNTTITRGQGLEIEGGVGDSYRLDHNTITSTFRASSIVARPIIPVGYPTLRGGHPNAIQVSGVDVANMSVLDNTISVGGGAATRSAASCST